MTELPEVNLKELDEKALLHRIAQEMGTIRRLASEMAFDMREAEYEVPESLRRFMNYYHDVHDIKYMHESQGHTVPPHILRELERLDDRYRQVLEKMHQDGGAIEKIRREMAADPKNRWDHTRQLQFKAS